MRASGAPSPLPRGASAPSAQGRECEPPHRHLQMGPRDSLIQPRGTAFRGPRVWEQERPREGPACFQVPGTAGRAIDSALLSLGGGVTARLLPESRKSQIHQDSMPPPLPKYPRVKDADFLEDSQIIHSQQGTEVPEFINICLLKPLRTILSATGGKEATGVHQLPCFQIKQFFFFFFLSN